MRIALIVGLLGLLMPDAAEAATITTADTITTAERAYFNGFEAITTSTVPTSYVHIEGGIRVRQVNGDHEYIQIAGPIAIGGEGNNAWYPTGGDRGYTEITRDDGSNFGDVGFLWTSGFGVSTTGVMFDLLDDGVVVQSGTILRAPTTTNAASYAGFIGGGFDTIRLRDNRVNTNGSVTDGSFQALAIDAIEATAVPLPSAAWAGVSLLAILHFSRRVKPVLR